MSDQRRRECESTLHLRRAAREAQRDVPSMSQRLAHDGAEPPGSHGTRQYLGVELPLQSGKKHYIMKLILQSTRLSRAGFAFPSTPSRPPGHSITLDPSSLL